MEIYIYRDGQNSGPYSPSEIQERVNSGRLLPTDPAWYEGAADWMPLSEVPMPILPPPSKALAIPQAATPVRLERVPAELSVATKVCPFCAEPIKPAALKCKHCGETLDPKLRAAEEAKRAKQQQPNVYMNAAVGVGVAQKHNFPHVLHLLVTLITVGFWFPIWILHYIFRDRSYYY